MDIQFHLTYYQTVIPVNETTVKYQEKLKKSHFRETGLPLLVLFTVHNLTV